jgi:alkylhydroperoxidase family enzyme
MNDPLLMFPDGFRAIQAMHEATSAGGLPDATCAWSTSAPARSNGCGFCAEMHSSDMREAGASEERMFTVM